MTLDILISFLPFAFLALSFLSLWLWRIPQIWGTLLTISLLTGIYQEYIDWIGIVSTLAWIGLWLLYQRQKNSKLQSALFAVLIIFSFGFKLHFFPGYNPLSITPKFLIGFDAPLVGLLPLALCVPLAKKSSDWKQVSIGVLYGLIGIAALAILAVTSGVIHGHFKLPTLVLARYLCNFIFTAIPEEGFYRAFVQERLTTYLHQYRAGKLIALVLSSLIFTAAHIYWSPSLDMLCFVFLASMLYGFVYSISEKVESAIFCHSLLNAIHMTFFSYHAM